MYYNGSIEREADWANREGKGREIEIRVQARLLRKDVQLRARLAKADTVHGSVLCKRAAARGKACKRPRQFSPSEG